MKKLALLLLAGTAGVTMAVPAALAADLPIRSAPPAPAIAAVPIFTWTGFYVGANAGVGWNTNSENDILFIPDVGFVSPGSNDDAVFSSAAVRSATTTRSAPSCSA